MPKSLPVRIIIDIFILISQLSACGSFIHCLMEQSVYQKGKFYNLPILDIIEEDGNAYFHVKANEREYLIRMFDFQKKDIEVRQLKELPAMVKDIHGDTIVFVQNFARMFGKDYNEDESYPFIVQNQGKTQVDNRFFYNVRDVRGVVFKLTTPSNVYLRPQQKIYCKVRKISADRLRLEYSPESKAPQIAVVSPFDFLARSVADTVTARRIELIFKKSPIFSEARELLKKNDNLWIVKALLAVPDYWARGSMSPAHTQNLVAEYIHMCLFLLEESQLLRAFPESERENYQSLIAEKIQNAEIYSEVLAMEEAGDIQKRIDGILYKIKNSGFIYRPEHKIAVLIAIFTIWPSLLEERIDEILDIIEDTGWSRSSADFRKAFCLFMTYYIDTNRDTANRTALVNDAKSNRLLTRIIRALYYFLLMTEDDEVDLQLYRSLLYHYLSYVRYNSTIGVHTRGIVPPENLIERAFQALMAADSGFMKLNWHADIKSTEVFAYKMAAHPLAKNMLATKSLESDTVRFTVNNDKITIAPAISKDSDHNVIPPGLLDWHDIQIYLPNAGRYGIAKNAGIYKWREWWGKIDHALFTQDRRLAVAKLRKLVPDVGQNVMIRVLYKDDSDPLRPYRYFCQIEDDGYFGQGYLDVYGVKATTGMFRYNPDFDTDSFYYDGNPLLIEVRVNAIVDPNPENPVFMFDAMGMLDDFIKDNCRYDDDPDCRIIFHDKVNKVMLAVSHFGYGVFIPDHNDEIPYAEGDTVKVRLTDASVPRRIQAEVTGLADEPVVIRTAAEDLLAYYCDYKTFRESEDQLAEDALSLSDDLFEPSQIQQLIAILDHKALMEEERASAYGYLSIARILARMTDDGDTMRYLDQRLRMLVLLEDFGNNGRVDNEEFQLISEGNEDFIEKYPLLKEKLCQIKIVDSLGRQERNPYLWDLVASYPSQHLIGKLARLMLSYNLSDGMQLSDCRTSIIERIKSLLNIKIAVPKIYSFGEEGQLTEFKTSIIYPPEEGMKPNPDVQTFNILKVICGMANAYGGTLYLGVYDTGSAKGLEDDLAFPIFGGSKDKYRNYLRNRIHLDIGGGLNASIVEEFPDAGGKWVYALKIRPSVEPVGVKRQGSVLYFLREGASTYQYDDLADLRKAMADRRFSEYGISADYIADFAPDPTPDEEPEELVPAGDMAVKKAALPADSEKIATGRIRQNVVNNWEDGYGVDTCGFLRFNGDGTWCTLDEIIWDEGNLTISVLNEEREGMLLLIYADGEVQKVAMKDLLKSEPLTRYKMRAGKRPVFICPAKLDDALLVMYVDSKGRSVMRLDDISNFRTVKMTEPGDAYPDCNLVEITRCEIIPAEHHELLSSFHNLNRNCSFFTNHTYGGAVREALAAIGVEIMS